jgi:hypothetical protein
MDSGDWVSTSERTPDVNRPSRRSAPLEFEVPVSRLQPLDDSTRPRRLSGWFELWHAEGQGLQWFFHDQENDDDYKVSEVSRWRLATIEN